jgi:hypothetical protein
LGLLARDSVDDKLLREQLHQCSPPASVCLSKLVKTSAIGLRRVVGLLQLAHRQHIVDLAKRVQAHETIPYLII